MTDTIYATGRVFLDADSHVVETEEWMLPYVDPSLRSRLRPLDFGKGGGEAARKALQRAERRAAGGGPALRDGDTVMSAKGWTALGAFDKAERTAALQEAIDLGCPTVLIPSRPRAEISPTHPDFDGVWGLLAEANIPFMLHIGGGGNPVTDWLGGGENIRAKDFMAVHHTAEVFLGAMVLDGVFERFADLRGGCIELGAMWVVDWLKRLDIAQSTFARSEPSLNMPLKASEY